MGPGLSMVHESTMPPWREMRPNVGRRPLRPLRLDGLTIEPWVSVPMEKPTRPAAVAEPGPADDPLDPCSAFQGFLVRPRYQLSPAANCPVESLAIRTAPASRRRTTNSESSSMT